MKKCPVCGTGKARRVCSRRGGAEVCSECCATARGTECGDCVHYDAARHHEAARNKRPVRRRELAEGEFIIELNPEVEEAVNNALASGERGDLKQAQATLARLLREHPRNHDVCFGMGALHAMQKELQQAIEWFDKALEIYPNLIEAHFNKAVAFQNLRDLPNCVRSFRKVVQLGDRDDSEVTNAEQMLAMIEAGVRRQDGIDLDTFLVSHEIFLRAFTFMEREEWQQAVDAFREVITLNDRNVASHGNLGLCYAQMGHKAKALAELDRALELNPAYEPARINRKSALAMTEGTPLKPGMVKTV